MNSNTSTLSLNNQRLIGLLYVIIGAFCFSAKAVIVKLAYSYGIAVSPIIFMTLRMSLALPFFLAALYIIEKRTTRPALTGRDRKALLGLGIIGFYLAAYLDFLGLSYINASLERLILLLYPTLVVLISALFFKHKITPREAAALIVSYIGITIVFADELLLAGTDTLLGSALIFGSATAYALYLAGSGELIKRIGSLRFTAYAMTIASIATLIHFAFEYDATISRLPAEIYGLALLIAVVCTVIPAFLMNAGIHHIGAKPASIISAIGPVMTLFLAYLILNEQLTPAQFLGAALVFIGVFIVSNKKNKRSSSSQT